MYMHVRRVNMLGNFYSRSYVSQVAGFVRSKLLLGNGGEVKHSVVTQLFLELDAC